MATVSIAVFATAALTSFQALGVTAALPDIAGDLGNVSLLPWVITATLLTSSIATVVSGPFVDAFGASRMFKVSVVVFTVTGFAAALAPTMAVLLGLRALQGAGAGLILATGSAVISLAYPEHLVGRAFAANATVWGVMGVAGPGVAAFILTFLSWEWIFYINLPLGVIALVAGWRVLPAALGERLLRFDLRGTVLIAGMTVAALLAVDAFDPISFAWLAAAVAAAALYGWHAPRREQPVVRLEHIAPQPYRGLGLAPALMLTGTFAMGSYIPLYVRAGVEGSSALTAWSVLPLTVGWTTGAQISSRLQDRHSESWIMVLGFAVNIPALAAGSLMVAGGANVLVTFAAFLLAGVGVGITTNAALTLVRAVTDPTKMGRVGAAHLFVRNQGFTFGAAIGGAVIILVITGLVGDVELVRDLITGDADPAPGAAGAVEDGFAAATLVGVGLSLLGWLAAARLRTSLAGVREIKRGMPQTP